MIFYCCNGVVSGLTGKMVEPQYQELLSKDVPHVSTDGVHVAVIAGDSYGASVNKFYVMHILLADL